MTKSQLLFDSNIIYKLIRELPQAAVEKLVKGTTIYLAYYELGNALWRECLLLRRISLQEAEKSLGMIYSILECMKVASIDNEAGIEVLDTAYKFNLTFYDTAYLVAAKKSGLILVTDDIKLAKAAVNLGIDTLSSESLMQ
jgi:predicted nucleic acid-binding protein